MRRVACVHLPEVRLEIASPPSAAGAAGAAAERGRGAPAVAIVIARPGGAVHTERDVLGNTRLDVVSAAAHKAGVRPGHTVAAARARLASLRVKVVAESSVQTTLARVAEAALSLGPTVGFDVAHDVVWVDVTGCAHLHGGEVELARALEAKVGALGHACRVAIANGPRIASAVARFSKHAQAHGGGPLVVPEGAEAAAMRVLPVAALGLDEGVTAWLRELGLARCGSLQRLPRRSLGTRLGLRTHDVMQLLDGDDRAPLPAWRPPEVPEERVELEWGASSIESLSFVIKTLCDRLAARLEGRAMAAAKLELVLSLDRALCERESGAHRSVVGVVLPVPLSRAGDLLAVLRTRLEGHELPAPALALTLTATELARVTGRTVSMLEPEPVADRVLPRLVAELSAELGPSRVGLLSLADTWVPEERTELTAFAHPDPSRSPRMNGGKGGELLEPTRILPPEPVAREVLGEILPLARLEAVEWWRRPPDVRDLVAAWRAEGGSGALAWVDLRGEGEATRLGWID